MRVDKSAAFVQVFITRFPLAYRCFSCRKIKRMPFYVPFYTCAIFDFFRKKEQVSDRDNKNSQKSDNHQLFKYIVDRSTADWNQVVKFGKGLEKTRENWSKQFQRLFTTVRPIVSIDALLMVWNRTRWSSFLGKSWKQCSIQRI
jgi:hypothetical protein